MCAQLIIIILLLLSLYIALYICANLGIQSVSVCRLADWSGYKSASSSWNEFTTVPLNTHFYLNYYIWATEGKEPKSSNLLMIKLELLLV